MIREVPQPLLAKVVLGDIGCLAEEIERRPVGITDEACGDERPHRAAVRAQQLLLARAVIARAGQHLGTLVAVEAEFIGVGELGQVPALELLWVTTEQLAQRRVHLDEAQLRVAEPLRQEPLFKGDAIAIFGRLVERNVFPGFSS